MSKRPLLIPGYPRLLHGGDYNPDQWLKQPEAIDEDFRLMKLAGCNTFSVGIFAWTSYEREEGVFDFAWLDRIMDRMAEAGSKVLLATPSGSKPAWLSQKYPEVRRVTREGLREPHAGRHNHCWSSPVYRAKVAEVNGRLAERYARHPALGMWHVSNEYSGECLCELCLASFHGWLARRYGSVEALNEAWWTSFWSHTFTRFDQIDPRDPSIDALKLDFRRFTSEISIDFVRAEIAALRRFSADVPVTTNLMGTFPGIDYSKLVAELDLVADDQYPGYSPDSPDLERDVLRVAFKDDLHRSFKPDRPWLVMESCPDAVQWRHPVQLKRPHLHQAEMLQALGHGAEGTCYFQWRKNRGGGEKLHGAVVDHVGHENTRVFRAVAELGARYEALSEIMGSETRSEVALIYDWEVRWAFEASEGVRCGDDAYFATCVDHYAPFARRGISVDVVGAERDLSAYKLVIAPQLWMLAPGVAARLARYVESGGTLVTTYYSGYCDQNNRCFLGGFPGDGLMSVLGIWNEETDWLPAGKARRVVRSGESELAAEYTAHDICALVTLQGATSLLDYAEDFYAGTSALTHNSYGRGVAYYQAARFEPKLQEDFYEGLSQRLPLARVLGQALPWQLAVQRRVSERAEYLFLQNFWPEPRAVSLPHDGYFDLIAQREPGRSLAIPAWGSTVLRRYLGSP